jgi:hypothetical protein
MMVIGQSEYRELFCGAGSEMTSDEKSLLKHGLVCAAVVAGFWFLISSIRSRVGVVICVIVWTVLLYAIFYRDARKKD